MNEGSGLTPEEALPAPYLPCRVRYLPERMKMVQCDVR